jgi:putative transposase
MGWGQDLRRRRHCVSALDMHLVVITKYRRGVLDAKALEWLNRHFAKVCEALGARLLVCDGADDDVHHLAEYPPELSVSALVNILKGTSSRLLPKQMGPAAKCYWNGTLWTPRSVAAGAG